MESKAQSLKDAFTRLDWEKTTHQLAFQPVARRSLGEPQPIGKWSLPSYWHGSPCPGNTQTGWFLEQRQRRAQHNVPEGIIRFHVVTKMQISQIIPKFTSRWKHTLEMNSFFPLDHVLAGFYFFSLFPFSLLNHSGSSYIPMYLFEATWQCHWCYSLRPWNHEQSLFLL